MTEMMPRGRDRRWELGRGDESKAESGEAKEVLDRCLLLQYPVFFGKKIQTRPESMDGYTRSFPNELTSQLSLTGHPEGLHCLTAWSFYRRQDPSSSSHG